MVVRLQVYWSQLRTFGLGVARLDRRPILRQPYPIESGAIDTPSRQIHRRCDSDRIGLEPGDRLLVSASVDAVEFTRIIVETVSTPNWARLRALGHYWPDSPSSAATSPCTPHLQLTLRNFSRFLSQFL